MNVPRIIDAMDHIDDRYISGSIEYRRDAKKRKSIWKYIAIAACFTFVLTVGVVGGRLSDIEADPNFMLPGTSFCETDDAYYGIAPIGEGYRLMYYAKYNGASGVLCAKDGCAHSTDICNAFVPATASGLSVYEGRLYWTAPYKSKKEAVIYSIGLDGTGKETVKSVSDWSSADLEGVYAKVHRGYMYFAGASGYDGIIRVTAESLASRGERINILERPGEMLRLQMSGNKITILIYSNVGSKHIVEVCEWDASAQSLKVLYSGEVPIEVSDMRLNGGSVYLVGRGEEAEDGSSGICGIYLLDIKSRQADHLFDFSGECGSSDIYLSEKAVTAISKENGNICVKDYSGSTVFFEDLSWFDNEIQYGLEQFGEEFSKSYIGSDDKYLFFDYCGGRYTVAVPFDSGIPQYLWNTWH